MATRRELDLVRLMDTYQDIFGVYPPIEEIDLHALDVNEELRRAIEAGVPWEAEPGPIVEGTEAVY